MSLTTPAIIILFNIVGEGEYPWYDYPGLELWKFLNLFIFIAAVFYIHHRLGKPAREGLRSRSEKIKRELTKAREERDRALAKLAEVETRFATLDDEVAALSERARKEAEAERDRLRNETEQELAKLRENAKREIESAGKAARHDLQRFAAQESVRLAEQILRKEISPEDDARLSSLGVRDLRRKQG